MRPSRTRSPAPFPLLASMRSLTKGFLRADSCWANSSFRPRSNLFFLRLLLQGMFSSFTSLLKPYCFISTVFLLDCLCCGLCPYSYHVVRAVLQGRGLEVASPTQGPNLNRPRLPEAGDLPSTLFPLPSTCPTPSAFSPNKDTAAGEVGSSTPRLSQASVPPLASLSFPEGLSSASRWEMNPLSSGVEASLLVRQVFLFR